MKHETNEIPYKGDPSKAINKEKCFYIREKKDLEDKK